jgi:hypothetical protein
MALVDKPEVGCQTGQVALAAGKTLEGGPGAEAHSVARDGGAVDGAENTTEVVRRDREVASEVGQGATGVGAERFPGGIG